VSAANNKIKFITRFISILSFFLFVPTVQNLFGDFPLGTLHSIEYSKVIIIAGNGNDVWPVSCKINYIYNGKSIAFPDIDNIWSYDFFLDYSPKGKISYLTSKGESLPGAADFFKDDGKDGLPSIAKARGADYIIEPGLTRGEKDTINIQLLYPWLFKNTDIDEAMAKKSLSSIKLSIETVDVQWKYVLWTKDGKDHVQEGEFTIVVDKTIEIKIKYKNKDGKKLVSKD
jgi:hypothetical protein